MIPTGELSLLGHYEYKFSLSKIPLFVPSRVQQKVSFKQTYSSQKFGQKFFYFNVLVISAARLLTYVIRVIFSS
jgi:hypothetical protein